MDMHQGLGPSPTPSSEIIHLVTTFADTLDALPPSLTRSLSDLKELDAVLSGSLQTITDKLQLLVTMMNPPLPGSPEEADAPVFTPLQRLQLLREVTEEARIFRLGGEDKIRVATGTCETIATHTSHLSTLSTLLLSFLPAHLLPQLPPPSAPHGYPSSTTPASALARRQNFDYPPANYPGSGSSARLNAAMGMVKEHWELTRGGGQPARAPRRKPNPASLHLQHNPYAENNDLLLAGRNGIYPKKKQHQQHQPQHSHSNGTNGSGSHGASVPMSVNGNSTNGGYGTGGGYVGNGRNGGDHAVGAVGDVGKGKRAAEQATSNGNGTASRGGGNGGTVVYPGMATAEEYAAATAGGGRSQKRKVEDAATASKRRKKGPDSPDVTVRTIPVAAVAAPKAPRRTNSKLEDPGTAAVAAFDDEDITEGNDAAEDDGDGHTYCVCNQVSFGEMIGCDGSDCDREWFHLSCVGLQAIPKGRWFCDDCRRANEKAPRKRR